MATEVMTRAGASLTSRNVDAEKKVGTIRASAGPTVRPNFSN